jgi:TctA family transporter
MSQDHLSILVTRPIAVTILILAALTTITGIRRQRRTLRQQAVIRTLNKPNSNNQTSSSK